MLKKSKLMIYRKSFFNLLCLVFFSYKTYAANNLAITQSKNGQQIYEKCESIAEKLKEDLNKSKVIKNDFEKLIKRADAVINTLEGLSPEHKNDTLNEMDIVLGNINELLSCKSEESKNWLNKVNHIEKINIYNEPTSILPFDLIKKLKKEEKKLKNLIKQANKDGIPENNKIMARSIMYYKETANITKLSSEIEKEIVKLSRVNILENRNNKQRNIRYNEHKGGDFSQKNKEYIKLSSDNNNNNNNQKKCPWPFSLL